MKFIHIPQCSFPLYLSLLLIINISQISKSLLQPPFKLSYLFRPFDYFIYISLPIVVQLQKVQLLTISAEINYMTERQLINSRDVKQCRICLQNDNEQNFCNPCLCKGCLKEYFEHRFKAANRAQRRRMKQKLQCQICKQKIKGLSIRSGRRCSTCKQVKESLQIQDIFFLTVYILLYIGFHVVGIIIIVQDSLLAKIIGAVWLIAAAIAFNYGLYKLIRKLFTVRQAQVMQQDRIQYQL